MATKKKLLEAAAGSAGGAGGLNVEDVFSTYLYTGNNTTNTINNGIDLDGEGGLVWIKRRSNAASHALVDSERGDDKYLKSDSTSSQSTRATMLSFSSTGFSLDDGFSITNGSGGDFASWTFRKAPKFFDVVTYTGDGTTNHTIDHNLGSVPGCIMIKRTDTTSNWIVYHRGIASDAETDYLHLHLTAAAADWAGVWNDTAPTSTQFTVGDLTHVNASGGTFVAYLFAHNDGDGEFGSTADQDIIKCGSYTGNSTIGHTIDLGFEAQWVLVRSTSNLRKWMLYDAMRGMPVDGNGAALYPNSTDDEEALQRIGASNVGFQLTSTDSMVNLSGETYIYIAIRRGPMAVPESATDVFDVTTWTSSGEPKFQTSFASDMAMNRNVDSSYDMRIAARLTQGRFLKTSTTDAEASNANFNFDYMDGFLASGGSSSFYSWQWKRAPSFCDVVAYSGNSTAGRTVNHNLGVAPEMMWVKNRDSPVDWWCYHKDLGNTKYVKLNTSDSAFTDSTAWNNTTPTDTVITLGNSGRVNYSNDDYIAYLFASLDGVSKVGSYTGNGTTSNTIDCGFSTGARFIIVKRTDSTGDWWVFDTERGITSSGNDPYLELNTTNAEASYNILNANSSGFEIIQPWSDINASGGSYIFYAIA